MMNFFDRVTLVMAWAENVVGMLDRGRRLWVSVRRLFAGLSSELAVKPAYENAFLDLLVDIQDKRGTKAVLIRRQAVRFPSSNDGLVRDVIWGEGAVLAHYSVRGARRLAIQPEGSKQVVLLGLDHRPTSRTSEIRIRRLLRGAFRSSNEYFETLVERPTNRLSMKILFPRNRPPIRAYLASTSPERFERSVPVRFTSDRRPFLGWRLKNPLENRTYSLRWSW